MKYIKFFENYEDDGINRLGDLSFANTKIIIDSVGKKAIQIEKLSDGVNFLTIVPHNDGKYHINVTSGTINNPSKNVGSTWYELYDKRLTLSEVYDTLIRYGIATDKDKEFNLSMNKYNL